MAEPTPTDAEALDLFLEIPVTGELSKTAGMFARAVIARWGAQPADSVLEDAARYRAFIECGQPICFLGEGYFGKAALDSAIDAARKQGANHD